MPENGKSTVSPVEDLPVSQLRYVVVDGDRLSRIAASIGCSTDDLIASNPAKPTMVLASGERVFQSLAAGEELELPQGVVGLGNPIAVGIAVSAGAAALIDATKTLYRSEAGGITVCEEVYGGSWSYSLDKCIGPDAQVLDSTLPGLCHNLGASYDASADTCYCPTPGCTQMAPFILERFPDLAAENRKLPPFRDSRSGGGDGDGQPEPRATPEPGQPAPAPPKSSVWPLVLATGAIAVVGLGAAAVSVKLIVDAIDHARNPARAGNPVGRAAVQAHTRLANPAKTFADLPPGAKIILLGEDVRDDEDPHHEIAVVITSHDVGEKTLYEVRYTGDPLAYAWARSSRRHCYEIGWLGAEHGWGPLAVDILMERATELGGSLSAGDPNEFGMKVADYYETRSDVEHEGEGMYTKKPKLLVQLAKMPNVVYEGDWKRPRAATRTRAAARAGNPAPRVMNLEQYAQMTNGKTRLDVQGHIHAGLRNAPNTKTYKRFFAKKLAELQDAADRTRADYYAAIERGEIVPPPKASLEEIAEQDDDAGEAAKRVLKRRAARLLSSGK